MANEHIFEPFYALYQPNLSPPPVPEQPPHPFPVLSWNSTNEELSEQMLNSRHGVMIINNLNVRIPMIGVRDTFCELYQEPKLGSEYLNPLNPPRGVFKNSAFYNKLIDQKIAVDLGPNQITQILESNENHLGTGFMEVLDFYNTLQGCVIPRLVNIVSRTIGGGAQGNLNFIAQNIRRIHYGMNYKLRLIDYFPVRRDAEGSLVQRYGPHRDYSTFTMIFQDRMQGGLEINVDHAWIPVPAESQMVLLWGWSTFILSNGRLPVPLYRVVPTERYNRTKFTRRNEIIVHVSPDWDAHLIPYFLNANESLAFKRSSLLSTTVRDFKDRFKLKWHLREGTITPDEVAEAQRKQAADPLWASKSQDDEIVDFLIDLDNVDIQVEQRSQ